MVGSAIGGTVQARNIAGGDIHEHHHYPQPAPEITFLLIYLLYDRNPNFTGRVEMLARLEQRLGSGRILITSRRADWSGFVGQEATLPLDIFTPAESLDFLQQRLGAMEATAANALAETLGHFPLALEHAAAYALGSGSSLAEYHHLFASRWRELWQRASPPERYRATITTTWELAFERVKETAGALELLNLCCFLAPEAIPLDLMRSQTSDFFEKSDVSLSDPLALDDAIAALLRYSLLKREGETLSLHRLVQMVARDQMGTEQARQWAEIAIELLLGQWSYNLHDMNTWADSALPLPHLQAAAAQAEAHQLGTTEVALLWNATGFYLYGRGDYATARRCMERALGIREKALGPDHPNTATSLNNLGDLLQDMGELAAARPYLERALAIRVAP